MRGLTLIELVIVVVIVAIITVAGLVSFSTIGPKRLEAEARKIVGDLGWAREMAVAKHENYIVVFDIANDVYIIYEDRDGDGIPDTDEEIKRQDLEVDLVSVSPEPEPAQLQFRFPSGSTQSKQINLSYQGGTQQVSVFGETGYVRMQ